MEKQAPEGDNLWKASLGGCFQDTGILLNPDFLFKTGTWSVVSQGEEVILLACIIAMFQDSPPDIYSTVWASNSVVSPIPKLPN
jgi:hypothetical protein